MDATKPRVADAIATTMHAHGVRRAFGIPGNDVLELIRACTDAGISFTLAKSEAGAAFMADAVTHVTGQPAACIFALGPGIANGASGIAGAVQERSPIIVLGGEMAGNRREIYNHQAFDHVALMRPITKYAAELNAQRAGQQTARALDIAMTHPRGPVFLNCPADATRAAAMDGQSEFTPAPASDHIGLTASGQASVRGRIGAMSKPLALIGMGALGLRDPSTLKAFLARWNMPFLTTYKAKGAVDDNNPLCLGAVGLSPVLDDLAMSLVRGADGLVLIGFDPIELRDAWLDAWPQHLPIIAFDRAPPTHRIFPIGVSIVGNTEMLAQAMPAEGAPKRNWPAEALATHKSRVAHVVRPRTPKFRISPAALFAAVSKRVTPDMRMTVDVGAHRILANHVIQCVTPGQLLQSNGLGHMGYAIPAAIGAWLGDAKRVIAMLGDGCALMSLGELALVAELQAPIVSIILVDDDLALIDLKQDKMTMKRQGVGFTSPDFAMLARGFGLAASDVATLPDFESALDAAIASGKPHVIAAKVDPAEYWEQM